MDIVFGWIYLGFNFDPFGLFFSIKRDLLRLGALYFYRHSGIGLVLDFVISLSGRGQRAESAMEFGLPSLYDYGYSHFSHRIDLDHVSFELQSHGPNVIKTYYLLTKPGIILGNLITTSAGFALASRGDLDWRLFLSMLIGLGFVIASACVFNNYIDREIDKKMSRTKTRALATGIISGRNAILFAIFLGLAGIAVLGLWTNLLATAIAAFGFFIYVVLYSFWKTKKTYATLVGSIAGALPPVIGYCAVSSRVDLGAILLFSILVLWQMPHFFSIAMFRLGDYSAANIPVLPVEKGNRVTKIHMALYIIAFTIATVSMTAFGYTGMAYLLVAAPLGFIWLWLSIKGFKAESDLVWARQMFRLSLVIVTVLSFMISVDYIDK